MTVSDKQVVCGVTSTRTTQRGSAHAGKSVMVCKDIVAAQSALCAQGMVHTKPAETQVMGVGCKRPVHLCPYALAVVVECQECPHGMHRHHGTERTFSDLRSYIPQGLPEGYPNGTAALKVFFC